MKHDTISKLTTLVALALVALPAAATNYYVTTTEDGSDGACDAHCTLREAIIAANQHSDRDIINLPAGTYRLTIAGRGEDDSRTGDLDILERVEIRGASQDTTIIDAGGLDRVLHVHRVTWLADTDAVELMDLTLTGGSVSDQDEGAGVLNNGPTEMKRCTVSGNVAEGYESDGGGIANTAVMVLDNVRVVNNSTTGAEAEGGGIWNRWGILTLKDSTISGNTTSGSDGAGLYTKFGTVVLERVTVSRNSCTNGSCNGGGVWTGVSALGLVNSTISENSVAQSNGGGIWSDESVLTATNCTLSGNTIGGTTSGASAVWSDGGAVVFTNTLVDGGCRVDGHAQSGGGNIESPSNTCGFDRSSDQVGVHFWSLELGPLADNGGPTLTHSIGAGSAAIDRGVKKQCLSTDQRGEPRPQDGDDDGIAICDVGSYEAGEGSGAASFSYWVPVAVHDSGMGGTQWRTTLGTLNRSSSTAELELILRTSDNVYSMAASVAAFGQGVFPDVAGQLGVRAGKGTLEVRSNQPLLVTSRTYNESATGTFGQYYAGTTAGKGLRSGESATLPQLAQSAAFRTNVGVVNTGAIAASVQITLFDGDGFEVGVLQVELEPGQMRQYNQVFSSVAGLNDVEGGYAEVVVLAGSGIVAYGAVVDNGTGDAMTIPMWR